LLGLPTGLLACCGHDGVWLCASSSIAHGDASLIFNALLIAKSYLFAIASSSIP
jgi:hypothetical protein